VFSWPWKKIEAALESYEGSEVEKKDAEEKKTN
jgi:hypothetical protein